MTYDPKLLVPFGYGTALRTLEQVRAWLLEHHHPEYVERLVAWLSSKGGKIGVGGGWRAGGAQPNKPGFAPEGKSFHQDQNFADGFCGAAAVDLVARNGASVHRAPTWNEVPAQGSAEAKTWGVHCNVGSPGQVGSEPWHIQPIELDGWQTWWNQGRPAPRPNYPFPGRGAPTPPPPPDPKPEPAPAVDPPTGKGTTMKTLVLRYGGTPTANWSGYYSLDGGITRHAVKSMHHAALLVALGAVDAKTGKNVTSPTWADVTHTTKQSELDAWLTPGK